MSISTTDYLAMLLRLDKNRLRDPQAVAEAMQAAEQEDELQDQCIKHCRKKGWFVVFSRMDLPTTLPLGTPDLIVAADEGRIFWVECKSVSGKLRPAQLGVKIMLEKLGHRVHVLTSFGQFLEITK